MSRVVDGRVLLTFAEALQRLPDGPTVRCTRESLPGVLVVASRKRKELEKAMLWHGVEETGPIATRHGYGMALRDERGLLYIETLPAPAGSCLSENSRPPGVSP